MQEIDPAIYQDQLLRGLTHKMNNILSLFHGYLGMLMEDSKLDAATLAGLERIREGAYSASELMDRSQALIRPANVPLRELNLEEIFNTAQRGLDALATRGIQIQIRYAPNTPKVIGEISRVRTILSEIVSNAVEASPDHSIVRIEVGEDPKPGARGALVSVFNPGAEIPPETVKRVFEPFFTTRQKRSAFGLGLAIAQSLAKQIHSALSLDRVGDETVFRIHLPAA